MMTQVFMVALAVLLPFTIQSFNVLFFRKSIFTRFVPLLSVALAVFSMALDPTLREGLGETLPAMLPILVLFLVGYVLGWLTGLWFRKILDRERGGNTDGGKKPDDR